MQQKIRVQGNRAGLELYVDDSAELFGIFDRLAQNIFIRRFARAIGQVAVVVRAGDETHAAVSGIGVVDGQPDGDGFGGTQGPVAGVLVPVDDFVFAGQLAKVVSGPADDVGAQDVLDAGHDSGVRQGVVDHAVFQVGRINGITAAARAQYLG